MLEITRKTLTLEPEELIELERIITDEDREGAFIFLRKSVYRKLISSQENRLKSHLDGNVDPAFKFAATKK
jgi:hypothetical protein